MFTFMREQWEEMQCLIPPPLVQQCPDDDRHVVIFFEGWNGPWTDTGGKPIPLNTKSTLAQLRRDVISNYSTFQSSNLCAPALATEAYATDTDDDVKDLAAAYIKSERKGRGKIIIYGYSWGGDTAIELADDLADENIDVDLLVTIDAALGPFSLDPGVRDIFISTNVRVNVNHYTTTPHSGMLSQGLPTFPKDASKTMVINVKHTGPSHGEMDEKTKDDSVSQIVGALKK